MGIAAAVLVFITILLWPTSGGEEDLDKLTKVHHGLRVKYSHLKSTVTNMAKSLSKLQQTSQEMVKTSKRTREITNEWNSALQGLRTDVDQQMASAKQQQSQILEQITNRITDLSKACNTKPIPEHPLGGGAAGDEFLGVVQQGEQQEQKAGPPPPDPCKGDGDDESVAQCRRDKVKEAFMSSWKAYKEHAWGEDELRPVSMKPKNWGKTSRGLGLTMIDGVSTLWLMGFKDEFDEVRKWVAEGMALDQDITVSQFESFIRLVGGLLSAYELSGEQHREFLDKAHELTDRLMYAYNTSTGIPNTNVNLKSHKHSNPRWTGMSSILSEFTTVQLELRTLSYHTNNTYYDEKGTWIMDLVEGTAPADMLCPVFLSTVHLKWTTDHVTVGALGDSFYEYLLKQYLLTGKTEKRYRRMYEKAVDGIMSKLVKKSVPSGQTYLAELKHGRVMNKMDHLACFAGGMLALGAHELGDPSKGPLAEEVLRVAEGLTATCFEMYHSQPTGIAPEIAEFRGGSDMTRSPKAAYYLLRPEAVESFMYLWRLTKKPQYREWGWQVFRSIDRWCKTESGGYSGLRNVGNVPPEKDDMQQSFWLAETLKYLFLLFSDDTALDFGEWVMNTEGHPLKIRKRNPLNLWPKEKRQEREQSLSKPLAERVSEMRKEFQRRQSDSSNL